MRDLHREKPRFCTWYGYFLIFGSLAGMIFFAFRNNLVKTSLIANIQAYLALSPIVMFYVAAILSVLAFTTGIGIIFGKRFGWILAQIFFVFLLVRSVYGLIIISLYDRAPDSFPLWVHLLKFFLRASIAGFLFYYFNKKEIVKYFNIEREEANRIYLLSFATFTIIIFLRLLI